MRVRRIASRANPRLKEWGGLVDRQCRDRLGLTLAEGSRLVGEGLAGTADMRLQPRTFLVSDSGADRPEAGFLFSRAEELGVERISLSNECFAKISGVKNSDGLALIMHFSRDCLPLNELFSPPDAAWLVAAGVQDPGNAGALARIALASGWSGCIYLDGADPVSPKFLRGSMGASFRLACPAMRTADFLAQWPVLSATLIIAASGDGDNYRRLSYPPPFALVVGGERGIPEEFSAISDARAHIPLQGGVESLNLAVAAGIIMFQALRRES